MNGDLSKRFHHQTTSLWRNEGLPEEKDWPEEWKKTSFKTYPRFPQILLAEQSMLERPLGEILASRKTSRSFDKEALVSFKELSTILIQSAGIRTKDRSEVGSKRSYPSGGRRYPLEIYVYAERVSELEPGIYHYNVRDNSLELLLQGESCVEFKKSFGYSWSKDASLFLLITSMWDRTFNKYRDFGYKLISMEAGHLTQNIQLVSEALNLSYASIAGFKEAELDKLLQLDSENETSMYLSVIGKPTKSNQEIPSKF